MKYNNKLLMLLIGVMVVTMVVGNYLMLHRPYLIKDITGLQSSTDTGTALLQIAVASSLRFAVDLVNFGNGTINTTNGNDRCVLDTNGTNQLAKCINFTTVTSGFQIENDGSTNISVQLAFSNDADGFLGGTSSINEYRYVVSQNETQSCRNSTGGTGCVTDQNCTVAPIGWSDVNTTSPGTTICSMLLFNDLNDSLYIDINVTIPYDSPATVKTSTLTATGTTV